MAANSLPEEYSVLLVRICACLLMKEKRGMSVLDVKLLLAVGFSPLPRVICIT